jgi:hypothetical protein
MLCISTLLVQNEALQWAVFQPKKSYVLTKGYAISELIRNN